MDFVKLAGQQERMGKSLGQNLGQGNVLASPMCQPLQQAPSDVWLASTAQPRVVENALSARAVRTTRTLGTGEDVSGHDTVSRTVGCARFVEEKKSLEGTLLGQI